MTKLLLDLTPLDTPSRPRGIGRYIRDLVLGLAELPASELEGIELIGLTALDWTGRYAVTRDLAAFEGNPAIVSPTERDFYRWAYRHRLAFFRAARGVGAAAVHLCDPHATPLFMGLTGCKKIVTCHDLVPSRFPERYFGWRDGGALVGKKIERRRYASADLVVAISDTTKNDVCELLGVARERVVRVYNGVDLARWSARPDADPRSILARFHLGARPYALYAGGADWRKNAEGMMGGLAWARAHGVDMELAWAGDLAPSHRAAVDERAREAGVSDVVRHLGYVSDDDLAALYRHATAHLLVSRYEGFGLTVVEAMASGCPVVTTAGGALAEVAGDAALTAMPDNHAAIGAALLRMVKEPGLRADLATRGRIRAAHFSRDAQARAMAKVYRDVLNRRP